MQTDGRIYKAVSVFAFLLEERQYLPCFASNWIFLFECSLLSHGILCSNTRKLPGSIRFFISGDSI